MCKRSERVALLSLPAVDFSRSYVALPLTRVVVPATNMQRTYLFAVFVLLAISCNIHKVEAIDYKVAAMVPLSGAYSPGSSVTNQWVDLLQYTASQITSSWGNGNRLLITVYDTQSLRFRELQIASTAAADSAVLGVIAVGIPDSNIGDIALLLKLSGVRPFSCIWWQRIGLFVFFLLSLSISLRPLPEKVRLRSTGR